MGDISKARKNVGIQFGIWSVTLCMVAGLVMEMRPLVILGRAAIAFAASAMLGYILVSVIQIHSRFQKKPRARKPEEQVPESNAVDS